ncbi:DUF3160 domain-containing protein [Candidatus Bathyarchaeota archaeon]|nr:DUF3160 domain-containing protein [Candidatus Bathyarchaeota archaeon]
MPSHVRKPIALILLAILLVSSLWLFEAVLFQKASEESPALEVILYPTIKGYGAFLSIDGEVALPKASASMYSLPLDLSKVRNLEGLKDLLREKGLEKLRHNGFVVLEAPYTDLAGAYRAFKEAGFPIFVSTDSVLFVYHAFFDALLMELEQDHFIKALNGTLKALLAESLAILEALPSRSLARNASLRNLAYLSVATKLLDPGFEAPLEVRELVSEELALISEAKATEAISPIFSYEEDYTQYKPRGHYTASEALKSYFKAMMWLGRMRFQAQDPMNPSLAKLQTAQALILTYAVVMAEVDADLIDFEGGGRIASGSSRSPRAFDVWEAIYLPTSFIIGRSDDLTLYDYIASMKEVYGEEFTPISVEDEGKLQAFQEAILKLDKAKITNVPWWPSDKPRMAGLRFMGQRFILDGYIHQMLCFPEVIPRTMVKGLDVMAALGSERAEGLLEAEKRHANYETNLRRLQSYISDLTTPNWTESLYMGWLYTLKAEIEPPGNGYPAFMVTEAWLDKSLSTALSSWAQLRHDTILYAKQPYAAKVSLPPQQPHEGFVEPMPLVYSRLMNLVNATVRGLKSLCLLSQAREAKLQSLEGLLGGLVEISVKELKGESLSEGERRLIANYWETLEELLRSEEERAKDPRIVVDVFTDPNTNQVLEVGTGFFHTIIAIYRAEGSDDLYASVGAVMSYYEFQWPQSQRLTDEEWKTLLQSPSKPNPPDWTDSFRV